MREIKFRAWDGKKMHKVCRLGLHGFSTDLWSPSPIACDSRFSDSLKIMQWTGLKDRNGKEIYGGDIALHINTACFGTPVDQRKIFPVEWNVDENGWNFTSYQTVEVIGNIYENPELLK